MFREELLEWKLMGANEEKQNSHETISSSDHSVILGLFSALKAAHMVQIVQERATLESIWFGLSLEHAFLS